MFLRRTLRGILKLTLLAVAGLVAFGGWDYVQTAKASGPEYSIQDHLPVLLTRYENGAREAIDLAGPMIETAITVVRESEVVAQLGLDAVGIAQATPGETVASEATLGEIDVASVTRVGAPAQSLYPQARAVQDATIQR